jgi:hypothetical protein
MTNPPFARTGRSELVSGARGQHDHPNFVAAPGRTRTRRALPVNGGMVK